jgi:hypothetical protein
VAGDAQVTPSLEKEKEGKGRAGCIWLVIGREENPIVSARSRRKREVKNLAMAP